MVREQGLMRPHGYGVRGRGHLARDWEANCPSGIRSSPPTRLRESHTSHTYSKPHANAHYTVDTETAVLFSLCHTHIFAHIPYLIRGWKHEPFVSKVTRSLSHTHSRSVQTVLFLTLHTHVHVHLFSSKRLRPTLLHRVSPYFRAFICHFSDSRRLTFPQVSCGSLVFWDEVVGRERKPWAHLEERGQSYRRGSRTQVAKYGWSDPSLCVAV